jgi:MtN3 and saliva related transmembrane protein
MIEYLKYFVEVCFGLGMFVNAVLFFPQGVKLLKTKNVEGISLITFVGFNIVQLFGLLHGYIHKDYIFMCGMLLSLTLCGTITFLIILYKFRKNVILNFKGNFYVDTQDGKIEQGK